MFIKVERKGGVDIKNKLRFELYLYGLQHARVNLLKIR